MKPNSLPLLNFVLFFIVFPPALVSHSGYVKIYGHNIYYPSVTFFFVFSTIILPCLTVTVTFTFTVIATIRYNTIVGNNKTKWREKYCYNNNKNMYQKKIIKTTTFIYVIYNNKCNIFFIPGMFVYTSIARLVYLTLKR